MRLSYYLYSIALSLRILIALSTRSFFQPDEYFQSLEPAHHLVFGYGILTWEWLSQKPLRNIVYPALNVPIYWLLKVLEIDNVGSGWLLVGNLEQSSHLSLGGN
jgi:phosphatidylinositol glycan class B